MVANYSMDYMDSYRTKVGELFLDLHSKPSSPNDIFGIGCFSLLDAYEIDFIISYSKELFLLFEESYCFLKVSYL